MTVKMNRKAVGATAFASALLIGTAAAPLAGLAATPAPGTPEPQQTPAANTTGIVGAASVVSTQIRVANVAGTFSFDQAALTSNEDMKQFFSGVDKYLCDATGETLESVPIDQWNLAVTGAVENAFVEPLSNLADDSSLTVTMGCSCATNGADGRAVANADVTGITFESIYEKAGVLPEANTVTFISADGYSVSLPLSYVCQRYTLIVYDINGAPLQDSMGGTNQLWLGSTSARYFSRDIVEINFSSEQTPPPAPGSPDAGDEYANAPGVGVLEKEA